MEYCTIDRVRKLIYHRKATHKKNKNRNDRAVNHLTKFKTQKMGLLGKILKKLKIKNMSNEMGDEGEERLE